MALVAREAHSHALALVGLPSNGPHHLALLAVHDLVAVGKGVARPRVEDLVAHLVTARQRRRRVAAHLRTQTTSRKRQEGRAMWTTVSLTRWASLSSIRLYSQRPSC